MALTTITAPSEILIRFSPDPRRGPIGSVLTHQYKSALVTYDGDTFVSFVEQAPVDLTQDIAAKYLNDQGAATLQQISDLRQQLADALAKAADDLKAAQEKATADLSALQATLDAANNKAAADLKAANDAATAAAATAAKTLADTNTAATTASDASAATIADLRGQLTAKDTLIAQQYDALGGTEAGQALLDKMAQDKLREALSAKKAESIAIIQQMTMTPDEVPAIQSQLAEVAAAVVQQAQPNEVQS